MYVIRLFIKQNPLKKMVAAVIESTCFIFSCAELVGNVVANFQWVL